jgi:hypothetical protein
MEELCTHIIESSVYNDSRNGTYINGIPISISRVVARHRSAGVPEP